MATVTASVSGKNVSWQISGLGYPFDTRQYISAGICKTPFADGAASISDVLDTINAVTYYPGSSPYYASELYDSDYYPVSSISGYSSYNFNSSTGQYSNAGTVVNVEAGGTGVAYVSYGDYMRRYALFPTYLIIDLYHSVLISPGYPPVVGPTTIAGSFANAPVGTYYIYGWAKLQVNNLYYNAGSYQITVLPDGIVIKIGNGSGWDTYIAYIGNGSGWEPYEPKIGDGTTL